jgi:hypothetical protein
MYQRSSLCRCSTFCSRFHVLKRHATPATVQSVGLIIVLAVSVPTLLLTICQLYLVCRRKAELLARWSLCGTAIRLVLLVTPWLFYAKIFLPCFECYDFEAAATHEVGHILGLGHPDVPAAGVEPTTPAGENLMYAPPNTSGAGQNSNNGGGSGAGRGVPIYRSCRLSFDDVVPDRRVPVRPSIMISFTQHNPNVCLEADDLEAINAVYPSCDAPMRTPVCFKSEHNIGWVRLGVYILVPVIVALVLAVAIGAVTHRQVLQQKMALLRQKSSIIRHKTSLIRVVRRDEQTARERYHVAEDALERQKETEDARVQQRVNLAMMGIAEESNARPRPPPGRPPPGTPPACGARHSQGRIRVMVSNFVARTSEFVAARTSAIRTSARTSAFGRWSRREPPSGGGAKCSCATSTCSTTSAAAAAGIESNDAI